MNLEPASLIASLFVSSVGFVLFRYGRGQQRWPHTIIGGVMLVYPYFISDVTLMLLTLVALCVICWVMVRVGM